MKFRALLVAASLVSLSLSPLAAQSSSPVPSPSSGLYKIQPQDVLHVQVFQEEDLERTVRVSADTTIELPLIGVVNLKGKTLPEAVDMVRKLYDKDYIVNPQVTITVMEYAQRLVNVMGHVNKPGQVVIPPERPMTLMEAISAAGGCDRLARKSAVKLSRKLPDGTVFTQTYNLDDILNGKVQDVPVFKDDVVNVPEIFM